MRKAQIPAGDNWKAQFKYLELRFFRQSPDNWPSVLQTKLIKLDPYYPDRHAAHVYVLNRTFGLDPPLEQHSFGSEITVMDLGRGIVEPRIPWPSITLFTNLELDDAPLGSLGDLELED